MSMHLNRLRIRTAPLAAICLLALGLRLTAAADWPAWRGPDSNGHCSERDLPLKWSATENVRWKIPLPGPGNSTPIVSGGRIILTQATNEGRTRSLMCLDRKDGRLLWQRDVQHPEKEPTHATNPHCSASPATDGQRIVVSFGSAGVFCYDLDGRPLWQRDLGQCLHLWGSASSPVLHGDCVYLNFGPGERTFLVAMDKATGKELWRAEEPGGKFGDKGGQEWIGSWSTPVVATLGGREELIMSWPGAVKAYHPRTGEVLWTCAGLTRLVYTSPLVTPDGIVALSGFGGSAIAIRPGGSGDITDSHRLWRHPSAPQRIGSGVIVGEHVYVVNEPGTFQCIELRTGRSLWSEKLGAGNVWSSLVHADGRLYVTSLKGETLVLAARPQFEVLARNPLGEQTLASLAISDGAILVRTYRHLWCVEGRKP